jgi:hypothetical protein
MSKLFKRTRERVVHFCERCGSVCDSACRADAVRDRAREQAILLGARF